MGQAGIVEPKPARPKVKEFKLNIATAAMDLLLARRILGKGTLSEQFTEALEDYLGKPRGFFARSDKRERKLEETPEQRAERKSREERLLEEVDGLRKRLALAEQSEVKKERDEALAEAKRLGAIVARYEDVKVASGPLPDVDFETKRRIVKHRRAIEALVERARKREEREAARAARGRVREAERAARKAEMARRAEERLAKSLERATMRARREAERAARPARAPGEARPWDERHRALVAQGDVSKGTTRGGLPRVVPCAACGREFDRMEGRENRPGRPATRCRSCRGEVPVHSPQKA